MPSKASSRLTRVMLALPVVIAVVGLGLAGLMPAQSAGALSTTSATLLVGSSPALNLNVAPAGSLGRDNGADCGFSTPTASGLDMWVFCDTPVYDKLAEIATSASTYDVNQVFVPNGTAGFAPVYPGDAPWVTEHSTSAIPGTVSAPAEPTSIFPTPPANSAQWTQGIVSLPPGGAASGLSNTVLDFSQNFGCFNSLGLPTCSPSGGEVSSFTYNPYAGATQQVMFTPLPTPSNALAPGSVFAPFSTLAGCSAPGSAPSTYTYSPVVSGGYLYVYAMVSDNSSCTSVSVARVNLIDSDPYGAIPYDQPADYEYWTGNGWESQQSSGKSLATVASEAANILPADGYQVAVSGGLSVAKLSDTSYVMFYIQGLNKADPSAQGGLGVLRSAPNPWGPWSAPTLVDLPGCYVGTSAPPSMTYDPPLCRAPTLHPDLGSSGTLALGYYLPGAWNDRLIDTEINGAPVTSCNGAPATSCPISQYADGQVMLASIPLSSLPRTWAPSLATGAPQVVEESGGTEQALWRGANGDVWTSYRPNNYSSWSAATDIGGNGEVVGNPSASVVNGSTVVVVWRQSDLELHGTVGSGAGWLAPSTIGDGPLGSDPQVVAQGNGQIDVFWRSNADQLLHIVLTPGSSWSSPSNLLGGSPFGALATSDPDPVVAGSTVTVLWRGLNGSLWRSSSLSPTVYSAPADVHQSAAETLGGKPGAVGSASGGIDVFWRGTDNGLYHDWYSPSYGWDSSPQEWNAASSTSPGLASDPSPVLEPGSWTPIDVYWEGTGGSLWHTALTAWLTISAPAQVLGAGSLTSAPATLSTGSAPTVVFRSASQSGSAIEADTAAYGMWFLTTVG